MTMSSYQDDMLSSPDSPHSLNNQNLQMQFFAPAQPQEQPNILMSNVNYIPSITEMIAPTTSSMDMPSTSYETSLMMVGHQDNSMSGGTTIMTAFGDYGLINSPTQVDDGEFKSLMSLENLYLDELEHSESCKFSELSSLMKFLAE